MSSNQVSQEFIEFISALRSPDNAVRDQAESHLDQLRNADVLSLITQFFNVLQNPGENSQRAFVAVILRKVINSNAWKMIQEDNKIQILSFLLQLFQNEADGKVRHSLCDIICQLSGFVENWPELFPCVIQSCSTDNRCEGLYLLSELSSSNEEVIINNLNPVISVISQSLQSNSMEYQVAASKAALKIMANINIDTVSQAFSASIPPILATIQALLNCKNEDALLDLLEEFDACISVSCSYLTSYLRSIVELCLSIGEASFLPSVRSIAADIVVSVAENTIFRKTPSYINTYMRIAVSLVTEIDDDEDWCSGVFGEEDELMESDNITHVIGARMIANIADILRVAVYKPACSLISECSRSQDWKVRRAVYILICHISEGCKKQMEGDLKSHVNYVLQGLNDAHPRVVYVALQSIAFLSMALPSTFQKKAGQQILSAIVALIQRNPCPRVQAIAASTLGQFCNCEMISKKIFKTTLAPLVQWLCALCGAPMPSVQSEAITCIGLLCTATKDDFTPYYHDIIQGIIHILSSPVSGDTIKVHVASCLCLSSLVSNMGKNASQKEAWEIMKFLLGLIEKTAYGDERLNCLLDCASEIFQYCEQNEQVQFLQSMIPYLINMTQVDVGYSLKQVVDAPEYENENGVEKTTVETTNMGKVQLSINTTAVETISNAVRLIHNLLIDAKQLMLPYISYACTLIIIIDAVTPLIDFSFHEEVRNLAARILPKLFEVLLNSFYANGTSADVVTAFYNSAINALVEQYASEDEATERCCLAESIRDMFSLCYESGSEQGALFVNQRFPIPAATIPEAVKTIMEYLKDSAETLDDAYKSVDTDERELEDARNEFEEAVGDEKDCIENLLDAVGCLVKSAGDSIQPSFNEFILPFAQSYMGSSFEYIKFIGVCAMDDMILASPSIMMNYMSGILEFYTSNMGCEDPCLRQACLYGVKLSIENYQQLFVGNARGLLSALVGVVTTEEAISDMYRSATDNAVSAIFSLLLTYRSELTAKEYVTGIQVVVGYLPMEEDTVEAQSVHERVVDEMMKQSRGAFDNKEAYNAVMHILPQLLLPFYDEGDNEIVITTDNTKMKIITILKSVNQNVLRSLLGELDSESKSFIMNLLA